MEIKSPVLWEGDQVCLVTGGAGFIGSHLIRELVRQNKKVVALDVIPDTSYLADCLGQITFVYGDVADMPHVMDVMDRYDVTHVFHLAYMLVPDTDNRLGTAINANCNGFHNVMEAARIVGVERVVWASTQSVYGLAESYPPGPVTEDVFVHPTTLYGACKLFCEHIARHYRDVHGLDSIGFRKSVAYGLGKSRRRDLSIAHLMVENPLLGRPIDFPVVDYYANYLYIKDTVRAYLLAAQAPRPEHLIFNIGGEVLKASEVVAIIKRLVPGTTVEYQEDYGLPHPIEVFDQDPTYARDELGYEPVYPLEAGVQDYIATIEAFGDQYKSAWTEFVITSLV